jgi:hypothetical protein
LFALIDIALIDIALIDIALIDIALIDIALIYMKSKQEALYCFVPKLEILVQKVLERVATVIYGVSHSDCWQNSHQ